ncbi:hypothetical protein PR048_009369 [Dryococelus australis]|uniref:Uncharacterized protein n=1 Tax=Dryococelus australis TaxID=614101 RepID=A0ABQ9HZS8_9NEOP|nr:hypothetical protein PR048_009369 [Dryococelus australis]
MAVKLLSRILARYTFPNVKIDLLNSAFCSSFEKWSSSAALDTCFSVERILLVVMQTLQNLPEAEGSEVVLSSGRLLCSIVASKLSVSLVKTVSSTINAYMEHVLGLLPDSMKNTSGFSDIVLRAAIVINNIFSSSLR